MTTGIDKVVTMWYNKSAVEGQPLRKLSLGRKDREKEMQA
jgi:hypothetical protein